MVAMARTPTPTPTPIPMLEPFERPPESRPVLDPLLCCVGPELPNAVLVAEAVGSPSLLATVIGEAKYEMDEVIVRISLT